VVAVSDLKDAHHTCNLSQLSSFKCFVQTTV